MTMPTAEFFRRSSDEGYFAFNAPLLAANGSPRALELFESMMSDHDIPWERRVDCLHAAIVPHRTRLIILETAADLLAKNLEEPVIAGVIESVFAFNWRWFGTHPPEPPAWRSAADVVLKFLIELGAQAKRRPDLPAPLRQSIDATVDVADALLARRGT
jgi:hypothetical protein